MRAAVRMWQGQRVPRRDNITADFTRTPDGYVLHIPEVLSLLATGGPNGIILGLSLYDSVGFIDRFFPQHIDLFLHEPLVMHEYSASLIRAPARDMVRLREHCQVNTFLKVVRDIRSGQVSRIRAERPPRSAEEGMSGSVAEQTVPLQRFKSQRRPGEP